MPASYSRLLAAVLLLALGSPAMAGERPVAVVELFTSQGCNSCPPADANLVELAAKGDVLALGYHVNYWDYLGWRDTYGRAEHTARQQEYAKAFGIRSVYTPQAVINGRVHLNGAKRAKLEHAIDELERRGQNLLIDVAASVSGESVVIDVGLGAGTGKKAHIVLVCYDRPTTLQIEGGENAGKHITYYNPVLETISVGMWDGQPKRVELPLTDVSRKGPGGCAVLVQKVGREGYLGPIIGASVIQFPSG
jgi:hypothetical protein